MISVIVKENESVDKALKRFKKKFDKANIIKEVRVRQEFVKPSVINKKERERAAYKQKMYAEQNY